MDVPNMTRDAEAVDGTRRSYLKAIGTTGIAAGLAGCSGDGGSGDGGGGNGNDGGRTGSGGDGGTQYAQTIAETLDAYMHGRSPN